MFHGVASACPQLRSYSRHDLLNDPFEDSVSEVRFRKQRVEMERRVSLKPSAGIHFIHRDKVFVLRQCQWYENATQLELLPPIWHPSEKIPGSRW